MSKREVDQSEFDRLKEQLSRADAAVKQIPISAISIDAGALLKGQILINGKPVNVSNQFLSRMGAMLRINKALTREMVKKGDTAIAASLINGLKEYAKQSRGNTDVIIIANHSTKEVVDICTPRRYKRISNDSILDITERLMNDNKDLKIETVDFNPVSGRASINLLNNAEIGFAQAGKDEFFKFGFSLVQTTKDTIVESYNQRLICTNGMRGGLGGGDIGGDSGGPGGGLDFTDKFRLGGTSPEEVQAFLKQIDKMKACNFVSPRFENAINRATSTKASLLEVEQAYMMSRSKIDEIDPELKKQYQFQMARNYFRGYGETIQRITNKGKDYKDLNVKQKAFIKTPQTIWEVINSLTYLGSNNAGYELSDKFDLKHAGGKLFAKGNLEGYDLEFAQYAAL
jgi:hypothetical protein